uniref:Uncharacterized protein n=1 Tax=Strigamia maritima TaxID=126957 RepID=T1IS72_STRMM
MVLFKLHTVYRELDAKLEAHCLHGVPTCPWPADHTFSCKEKRSISVPATHSRLHSNMMLKTIILLCICAPLIAAQRPSSLLGSSLDNSSARTNFSNMRNQGLNFPASSNFPSSSTFSSNSNFDSLSRPFGSLGSTGDLSIPNSGVGLTPVNPLLNTRFGMFNQNLYNQLLSQQVPFPYNQYPYNQYPFTTFMPQQPIFNSNGLGSSQLELMNNYPLSALYANQLGGGGMEPFYNNLLLSNRLQMQGYLGNQQPIGAGSALASSNP